MELRHLVASLSTGVISLTFSDVGDNILGSGSGFIVDRYLITNNHVFAKCRNSSHVFLRSSDCGDNSRGFELRLSRTDFSSALKSGSIERDFDYAILDIPALLKQNPSRLEFADPSELMVGDEVAVLGYPFGQSSLACHKGNVSSLYRKNKVDYIQVHASVNQANSGGPLIETRTGKVVGIITRKATGLTDIISELKAALTHERDLIRSLRVGGTVKLMGVDPLQALESSRIGMLKLVGEIERSANVGIGYAFSIRHISEEICFGEPD